MKPRVLGVGHAGVPTGYARVLKEILPRLAPSFDVTLFASNTYDRTASASMPGVRVRVNELLGDPYGRDQLPALLEHVEPHVVLLHDDLFLYSVLEEALAAYRTRRAHARVVVYCPVEWANTLPGNLQTLAGADVVVAYTEFGAQAIRSAFRGRGDAPEIEVIGHGVDRSAFRPVDGARHKVFPDRPELDDAFVVLNANRNSPRKKVHLTMQAFAAFASGKKGAYLYLHMGMRDGGIDVPELARELGISDRLLVTTQDEAQPRISDESLNLVYNASDVGLNTSTGEGWGLVAFEHAATGAPQIVPDRTAGAELWRDKALLVPVEPGREDDGIVSVDAVVAALQRLYADESLRARLGAAAREHALDPSFDWDTIAGSWKRVLAKEAAGGRSIRAGDVRAARR